MASTEQYAAVDNGLAISARKLNLWYGTFQALFNVEATYRTDSAGVMFEVAIEHDGSRAPPPGQTVRSGNPGLATCSKISDVSMWATSCQAVKALTARSRRCSALATTT